MPGVSRKYIAVALMLVAAFAVLWHWFLAIPAVETMRPVRGPAVQAVYASGSVEPSVLLKISPKLAGRLAALPADEHDQVKQGQILARLDDEEMGANVAELKAKLELAEREYERARTLLARHSGTLQERDRAESALHAARAALDKAAKQRGEFTLTAPADGIIIRRDGEIGDMIQANQTVFFMACCAPLRITAEVDEEDIPRVQPGQKVLIRADAFPGQIFEGAVDAVTPKGDPVARNFRVRIKIPAETKLMTGMTAEVNIVTGEKLDALLLPAAAVTGGKVWVLRDGRLHNIAVTTGAAGASMIEVTSGVTEQDEIAAQPESWFRPGHRARGRKKS